VLEKHCDVRGDLRELLVGSLVHVWINRLVQEMGVGLALTQWAWQIFIVVYFWWAGGSEETFAASH
jgi:hypothetical protein